MLKNISKLFLLVGITMDSFLKQQNKETKSLFKLKKKIFLLNLIGSKKDCTTKDIIDFLQIPPSTATGRLEKLDLDGYITREISPTDRRYIKLQLTKKGESIHRYLIEHLKNHILQLLKPLSNNEQHTFLTLFDKILNNIE